jgi:hypothetical protein
MSYDPEIKVYYGTNGDADSRIIPAPKLSISTEMVYANDTVVGYTYILNITGYATALDLSVSNVDTGIKSLSGAIKKLRDIFTKNSSNLYAVDKNANIVLQAVGGTLRSFTINESNNNWVNYAPYSAQIEFNEIEINGCAISENISCGNLSISSDSHSSNLVDINKYKLKSFNDSWSFDIGETAYQTSSVFSNHHFNVQYSISAVGKHFINDTGKLLPGWEQAKNFVQDRLHGQITALIPSILKRQAITGCSSTTDLSAIHDTGFPGLLSISPSTYKVFNESITCDFSEADSSFSATYNAIVKYSVSNAFYHGNTLHSVVMTTGHQDDNKTTNKSISIQGTITGLVEGGVIRSPKPITLPSSGKLFTTASNNTTRYSEALTGYNLISSGSDLTSDFKDVLGISPTALGISSQCSTSGGVIPSSHNVGHNYTDGIITYNVEYNSNRACLNDRSYRNVTVVVSDSVPLTAEFVIPGRAGGPLIQYLNALSPKRITLNIEGALDTRTCCLSNLATEVANICSSIESNYGLPSDTPSKNVANNFILTQDQQTINSIDGSYSISRSYVICDVI